MGSWLVGLWNWRGERLDGEARVEDLLVLLPSEGDFNGLADEELGGKTMQTKTMSKTSMALQNQM